jgi:hypothetical protein
MPLCTYEPVPTEHIHLLQALLIMYKKYLELLGVEYRY